MPWVMSSPPIHPGPTADMWPLLYSRKLEPTILLFLVTQTHQAIASACPHLEHLLLGGSSILPLSVSANAVGDLDRAAVDQKIQELLRTVDNGRVWSAGAVATEVIVVAQRLPALQTLELSFFPAVCVELCQRLMGPCTHNRVSVLNLCGRGLHLHRLAASSLEGDLSTSCIDVCPYLCPFRSLYSETCPEPEGGGAGCLISKRSSCSKDIWPLPPGLPTHPPSGG